MGDRQSPSRSRIWAFTMFAGLICVGLALTAWRVPPRSAGKPLDPELLGPSAEAVVLDEKVESQIQAFCGACHAVPKPQSFPRDRWHYEVKKGYEFYARSGRTDLTPPPIEQTVHYYRSQAPEQPVFPAFTEAERPMHTSFVVEKLMLPPGANAMPEISHVCWTELTPDSAQLVFCDMLLGIVGAVDLANATPLPRTIAVLNNPCHAEPCDLDGNGTIDLVVADQGGYKPYDHDRGRIVWLHRDDAGAFAQTTLASGLARVADVRPADFDGDGDLDLVVAEFGWHVTGRILLLRNTTTSEKVPVFEVEEIDDRPGAIHVPVHDFSGDGLPDFAALVSQEYESVDLFVNGGDGRFQLHGLWAGPDLTFGSSGIDLADLDGDGDADIIYTNGDAWDNNYASPWHGVQWLENLGQLQFAYHRLIDMPGAYRALAGDVDQDGDQDIVAVAWLPPAVKPESLKTSTLASVVCLEQVEPGVFECHTLETGSTYYATLELADFDGDGDLDFATGPGPHVTNARTDRHWLAVWKNQLATPDKSSP